MIDDLKHELKDLNESIGDLEEKIEKARIEAEKNVEPLNLELARVRQDKRNFANRNDPDSVHDCIRKESNLKFKINAQWNEHSILKNELAKLKAERKDLEERIKREMDKIRRHNEMISRMDNVLDNYLKTRDLRRAALESKINPESVEQWLEWGRNDFNETYSYFYSKVLEIDEHFKDLEAQKLKRQMDSVIEAYRKTGSLEKAAEIAGVSYDTVSYWQEWGSRGFGEENTYFFRNLQK